LRHLQRQLCLLRLLQARRQPDRLAHYRGSGLRWALRALLPMGRLVWQEVLLFSWEPIFQWTSHRQISSLQLARRAEGKVKPQ
jgi:hypothetical protein